MIEIWRHVKGWEDLYLVSDHGRVKSLPRWIRTRWGWRKTKERILRPRKVGKQREYLSVVLCDYGNRKQIKVHRLVAEAFIPNPNGYKEINHIDENKGNNCAANLEWCTRSYNVNYGSAKEKRVRNFRKPVAMLDDNGNILKTFNSEAAAATFAGVDSSNISRAISLRRKTKGYYWNHI